MNWVLVTCSCCPALLQGPRDCVRNVFMISWKHGSHVLIDVLSWWRGRISQKLYNQCYSCRLNAGATSSIRLPFTKLIWKEIPPNCEQCCSLIKKKMVPVVNMLLVEAVCMNMGGAIIVLLHQPIKLTCSNDISKARAAVLWRGPQ